MAETAEGGGGRRPASLVQTVTLTDLLDVLAAGLRDFRRAPFHGIAIGGIYVAGGWLLILLLIKFELPYLVYPLAAGFALVAPFIATGFYAISVCLERGDRVSWAAIYGLIRDAAKWDLGWMALVTGFAFFIWLDIAAVLFFGFLGLNALSSDDFLLNILTTPTGILFLVIGNTVGAVIALGVFSFSVTSFPMLFERDCDFVTAMVTSVRVVTSNPGAMIVWCAFIAILIGLSLLSGLIALLVTLPLLGHASWHLYRRALAPAGA